MVNLTVLFGASKARAEKDMKAVMELEYMLYSLTLLAGNKRNETAIYHPMPLSEVQKLYPEVPLVQYVKRITGVDVTKDEVVDVVSPAYITKEISIIQYPLYVMLLSII